MHPTTDAPEQTTSPSLRRLGVIAAALLVGALVVGTIGPPLVGRGTLLAADQSTLGYPWAAYNDAGALNIANHGPVTDTIDAVYPTRVAVAEAAARGNFFGWNPYVSGGVPAAAETSNGSLSPFMFFYLALPSWAAPAAIKLVQMLVAVGFTYLFGRRVGLDRVPALFAGAAFAGSGFLVMWTNWQQPEVAALIAPLFWATERYLQRPSLERSVSVALVVAAMLLAGFPAVTGFALYGLVVYVPLRLWQGFGSSVSRRIASAAGAGAGVVAGVLLVAAVVIPFGLRLGYLDTSSRSQSGMSSQGLATLVTTVAPKAMGLSTTGTQFFGPRNQIEAVSFLGVTTVLLALAALCLARPRTVPRGVRPGLALVAVGYTVLAFGGGPPLELVQRLPVFSDNFVGRASSVIGFTTAGLAGIGMQALVERLTVGGRWERAGAVVVVGLAGAIGAGALWLAYDKARDVGRVDVMRDNLVLPALIALGAIGMIALLRLRRPILPALAAVGLVLLLIVESLALSLPLLPNEDEDLLFPATPGTQFLSENVGHDRVAPEGLNLFFSATTLFGIRSATGHAFTAPTWKQALTTADPLAFAGSPTASQLHSEPDVVTSPMLDRLGARWFAASPSHEPIGEVDEGGLTGASCDRPVLVGGPTATSAPVATVIVPAGAGLRGVRVRACGTVDVPDAATLEVTATAGREAVAGSTPLGSTFGPGNIAVAVPADDLPSRSRVALTLAMAASDGRSLALATDADGQVAFDPIRSTDDGLRMAYAGDLRIYERTRALPRIRWAGNARVVEDPAVRLELLNNGILAEDTVVLSEPGSLGSGAPATVEVLDDTPTAITARVRAEGEGYLVVADALQVDWQALVDGQQVDLVEADHAVVAVPVPEGAHTVELRYRPRGQRAGLVVSALTAVGMVAALVVVSVVRRRRDTET